ncbi:L,D-transpeptidase [Mycobacterium sp. AMU20-3851]|uniref:L,D-transpeptidase n=1 Tax=Mycobacterium sp. AMU20-3851 TaxID=3122055 RepID=UPI003753F877
MLVTTGVVALMSMTSTAMGAAAVHTPSAAVAVSPVAGDVVGVAYPVTVTYREPVVDRAAAERGISFSAPTVPDGSYEWLDDSTVRFTPTEYWPAHSTITVQADGLKTSFETGAQVVGVADISAYTFTVSIDGEVAREMPASMGKPKFPTPVGRFTALGKESVVVMDSRTIGIPLDDPEGYKLTVYDAVRVTWGGVYVHGAPWSVGSQGYANVSHGCINLSPDNAEWYYNNVSIGDPIIVQA